MTCDLELEIAPGDSAGAYRVQVNSPAGAASGTLRLDVDGLLARRRELAAAVLASAVATRGRITAQERPIREIGQTLFESVFAGRVYGRYTASAQDAARRGEPLRVVLRLRAPELAGLPWETLFDPEADEYLCQREPVVRYVETSQAVTALEIDPPLRILGLVAAPRDLPSLDVAEERRRLTDAVASLAPRSIELAWTDGGSWPELQSALMRSQWHVLHFVGHGGVDLPAGEGVLALEDERTRLTAIVSANRFARLVHASRPVPRLVVLNSCQSGESAADDLLSSTAAALVHSGISAAVAMQFAVTDAAALAFSRGFYQALAQNLPVDEAVRLGRIAIDGTGERTLEWVTPVLYLRTDETRLFAIKASPADAQDRSEPTVEVAARQAALHALYADALGKLRTGRRDEALPLLESVLTLDPAYRDAAERRDAARREHMLETLYDRGRVAEDDQKWAEAAREYSAVTTIDVAYRDAGQRRERCERAAQIASLQEELRVHASGANWEAVLSVSEDLEALDPRASDPDGLASRARQELGVRGRERRRGRHGPLMSRRTRRRAWLVLGGAVALFTGVTVAIMIGSGGHTPPMNQSMRELAAILAFSRRGNELSKSGDYAAAIKNREEVGKRLAAFKAPPQLRVAVSTLTRVTPLSIQFNTLRLHKQYARARTVDRRANATRRLFIQQLNPLANRYLHRTYHLGDF